MAAAAVDENAALVGATGPTDHVSGTLSALDRRVVAAVRPGGNWRDLPADFPSQRIQQIRASAAAGEGSRSTYYGRLRPDAPSYTVSTYISRPGNGCFIHPTADRLITIREAARLQSFPDRTRFAGSFRQRCIQVGNAVPPLLAYQLGAILPPGSAVDLFCGAGGLSIGLAEAGHQVVLAVDNDAAALEAYGQNVGDHTLRADLTDPVARAHVIAEASRLAGGQLDLLAGGPPCQGFSTAGLCLADDPRNQLLHHFVDTVERLRPRRVMVENVLALAQSRGRRHLGELRTRLEVAGYRTDVAIMHAESYGVPQRRRRVVIFGTRGAAPRWPRPSLSAMTPVYRALQPHQLPTESPPITVREAIGDLPAQTADVLDDSVRLADDAASGYQEWARGQIGASAFVASLATRAG